MKGYYRHILLASAALLAAASCAKTHVEENPSEPMPISISAVDGATTKALLDNGTFKTNGNRIQVYAYAGGDYYFSDMIGPDVQGSALANSTEGVWPFVNGPHQWTAGEHKFYGWLVNDANGTGNNTSEDLSPVSIFGNTFACVTGTDKNVTVAAFNHGTQTLTFPVTDMNPTATQFDFMYSNIFTTEPINEPVKLEFNHLFAAYYFSFTNDSAEPLELESIKLNIKSNASATLNFSGVSPVANIAFQGTQPEIKNTDLTVGAGQTIDVLNDGYRLIWPQDLADATVDIVYTAKVSIPYYRYNAKGGPYNVYFAEEVAGGAYTYNGSYYTYVGKGKGTHDVLFHHDARGVYDEVIPEAVEQQVSKTIKLSNVTNGAKWTGGEKYNYNLSFSNDIIDLSVVVMKWDGGHGGDIAFN